MRPATTSTSLLFGRALTRSGKSETYFLMTLADAPPLQHATVHEAAEHTLAAAAQYEQHKLDNRDSAAKCQAWGVRLVPIVAESFGGGLDGLKGV